MKYNKTIIMFVKLYLNILKTLFLYSVAYTTQMYLTRILKSDITYLKLKLLIKALYNKYKILYKILNMQYYKISTITLPCLNTFLKQYHPFS